MGKSQIEALLKDESIDKEIKGKLSEYSGRIYEQLDAKNIDSKKISETLSELVQELNQATSHPEKLESLQKVMSRHVLELVSQDINNALEIQAKNLTKEPQGLLAWGWSSIANIQNMASEALFGESEPEENVEDLVEPAMVQFEQSIYADTSKLLANPSASTSTIDPDKMQWHLNLGLILNIYKNTRDPDFKQELSFLALNYLSKAAPSTLEPITSIDVDTKGTLRMMSQGGLINPNTITYHRSMGSIDLFLAQFLTAKLSPVAVGEYSPPPFLMDTDEVEDLLPLKFDVTQCSAEASNTDLQATWAGALTTSIGQHLSSGPDKLNQYVDPPIVFDLSPQLASQILKSDDPDTEQTQSAHYEGLRESLSDTIEQVARDLVSRGVVGDFEADEERTAATQVLKVYISSNIIPICRTQIEGVGVLQVLPQFITGPSADTFKSPPKSPLKDVLGTDLSNNPNPALSAGKFLAAYAQRGPVLMKEFLALTGTRLNPLRTRSLIFKFTDLERLIPKLKDQWYLDDSTARLVEYAPSATKETPVLFTTPTDLLRSQLWQRLTINRFPNEITRDSKASATEIMGRHTLSVLQGLLEAIPQETWQRCNDDLEQRMLVQTTMHRLHGHLANADFHREDWNTFVNDIELVHSEMAALIHITQPASDPYASFAEVFGQQVQNNIPPSLKGKVIVSVGLTKSAMNTFSGINSAIRKQNPKMQRTYGPNTYYEEAGFMGEEGKLDTVLGDKSISKVDLYVGEFNHNINVKPGFHHYNPGTVTEDLRAIMVQKNPTLPMTVAIDCTIDFVNSEKTKKLLDEFSKEIAAGDLNFVFFRSGQKFSMMGMDNYYGSPYYMVNNGDRRWSSVVETLKGPAFQTDPDSAQWFNLASRSAPGAMDSYMNKLFKNTRKVLDALPDDLKPKGNPHMTVSTVDKEMETCFIDVKFSETAIRKGVEDTFEKKIFEKFVEKGIKMHVRGSFGFYHLNLNNIDGVFRINPGLNEAEIDALVEVLQEMGEECAKFSK